MQELRRALQLELLLLSSRRLRPVARARGWDRRVVLLEQLRWLPRSRRVCVYGSMAIDSAAEGAASSRRRRPKHTKVIDRQSVAGSSAAERCTRRHTGWQAWAESRTC